MLIEILDNAGVCMAVAALISQLLGRITLKTAMGAWAVANFCAGLASVLQGDHLWSCICAASCAWCAYHWWHGGGGDGTRRRLKLWAGRFRGVRRTAPQGA